MKHTIAHFIIALCIAGLVRADQTVKSVQQALKDQGFYYGNVTGDKSGETSSAIRRYQIRNGLQVTGEIDSQTLQSLKVDSKPTSASSSRSASNPTVAQSNDVRPNQSAQAAQKPPAPQTPREPDRQLETNPAFASAPPQPMPPRINKHLVLAEVQRQLMSRGYYSGRIDGRNGRRTSVAVRDFQLQSGLPPTGRLDLNTVNALGLSNENLAYLQPTPRSGEAWVPVTKFKHGKWKVKWKKVHGGDSHEYGDENRQENAAAGWNGEHRDE
jgi:peptidoglycan hydrolase-like protein with peptidoglycan-binding domain